MYIVSHSLGNLGSFASLDGNGIQIAHHIKNNGFTIWTDISDNHVPSLVVKEIVLSGSKGSSLVAFGTVVFLLLSCAKSVENPRNRSKANR